MYNRFLTLNDLSEMNSYIRNNRYDTKYNHHLWYKDDALLKWTSILKTIDFFNIKNSKIVDLGCGDSIPPVILKDMNNYVLGFDHDPRARDGTTR